MGIKVEAKKEDSRYAQDNISSRCFRDLECWQKAHEFVKAIYQVTKSFPLDEQYGLTSQFRRAAVSIAANICEGYRKLSRADKLRFFNIAQGSLEECRYYIILSFDIGYIDQEVCNQLEFLVNGVSWKLNGYAESVSRNVGISDE
jgi:four helix bundle protein